MLSVSYEKRIHRKKYKDIAFKWKVKKAYIDFKIKTAKKIFKK